MSSFLVRNGAQSDFGKLLVLQQNLWNSSTVECTFRAYNNVGTSSSVRRGRKLIAGIIILDLRSTTRSLAAYPIG